MYQRGTQQNIKQSNRTERGNFMATVKATVKVTNRDFFNAIINAVENGIEISDTISATSFKEWAELKIEQLDKKSTSGTRKPTARQIENNGYLEQVLDFIKNADRAVTTKDIREAIDFGEDFSSQRLTAITSKLVKAGEIEVVKDKKVTTYVYVGNATEDEETNATEDEETAE